MSFRRVPLAAIAFVLSCLALHVFSSATAVEPQQRAEAWQRATTYFLAHPHLKVSNKELIGIKSSVPVPARAKIDAYRLHARTFHEDNRRVQSVLEAEDARRAANKARPPRSPDDAEEEAQSDGARDRTEVEVFDHLREIGRDGEEGEQVELDAAIAAAEALDARSPGQRWGYIPAEAPSITLFTHLFFHASWLHLLGNLLFLWLLGFSVEDRWGRFFFASFLLLSGAVGALALGAVASPEEQIVPLIGTSAVISAFLGVFLVQFASTTFRVFWIHFFFIIPRSGNFQVPAPAIVPAWILEQLLAARIEPAVPFSPWMHLVSFGFGALVALALRASKVDAKIAGRHEAEDVVLELSPELSVAQDHFVEGRYAEADAAIEAVLKKTPDRVDALELRIVCRFKLGRALEAIDTLAAALAAGARRGARTDAAQLWRAVKGEAAKDVGALPFESWMRLAGALKAAGLAQDAAEEYRLALRAHGISHDSLPAVVAYAELTAAGAADKQIAVALLTRGLEVARGDLQWTERILFKLRTLGGER